MIFVCRWPIEICCMQWLACMMSPSARWLLMCSMLLFVINGLGLLFLSKMSKVKQIFRYKLWWMQILSIVIWYISYCYTKLYHTWKYVNGTEVEWMGWWFRSCLVSKPEIPHWSGRNMLNFETTCTVFHLNSWSIHYFTMYCYCNVSMLIFLYTIWYYFPPQQILQ